MKEWTTPHFRNTPSTTNLEEEEEEIVDEPGNDGNASKAEQVKRTNPWMIMVILLMSWHNSSSANYGESTGNLFMKKDSPSLKRFQLLGNRLSIFYNNMIFS